MTTGEDRDLAAPVEGSDDEGDRIADAIADRLDVPVTAAGIIFLLLVVAETVSSPQGRVGTAFAVASWALWVLFVTEFAVRLAVAPSWTRYLRRNWWQIIFLAVPFLRFLRVIRALRVARTARIGRVLGSAVRSSRTAGRRLSSRLGTAAVVTVIVILAGSQVLFESGDYGSYADALHATALATIAGEPIGNDDGLVRIVELVLVAYSVVVFAALAGSFGAYLLERNQADATVAAEGRAATAEL